MSSDIQEYFVIFDTNVLYHAYDKKADFSSFSFNSTFENIIETKKPDKSSQNAAGCRNTQEVIYTQPLFITSFYLLKGYRSDRLDINIPVIPKAARRDGFTC